MVVCYTQQGEWNLWKKTARQSLIVTKEYLEMFFLTAKLSIIKIKACFAVFHHLQPLQQAPSPALCCPTRITSPDRRTTPVFCALTRTSGRSSAALLSSMIHCTRRRRPSMSVSQWPWVARWGPNSPLPKSPSWQTAMMVSGQSLELLLCQCTSGARIPSQLVLEVLCVLRSAIRSWFYDYTKRPNINSRVCHSITVFQLWYHKLLKSNLKLCLCDLTLNYNF